MTFRTAGRGVAGTCADSGGPDCHRRPRVRCKRYNLEVLARVYRGAGRRPVLRPARNPARAFEFAGARRSMVRRHPWVLPGSAVRANSRRQVPDRVSRVSVKMIRGAFGLEFLFINARGRLDRQGAEYSVVRERARLIRCVEPYQKGRQAAGRGGLPRRSCHFWRGSCPLTRDRGLSRSRAASWRRSTPSRWWRTAGPA